MAFATAGALSERAIDREERQGLVCVSVVVVCCRTGFFRLPRAEFREGGEEEKGDE